jgi:hypothetical protein
MVNSVDGQVSRIFGFKPPCSRPRFSPTSFSCLNLVKRWFAALTNRKSAGEYTVAS